MPFDFKDAEEGQQERPQERPQPILHKPRISTAPARSLVIAVIAVVVIGVGAIIAIKSGIFKKKKTEPPTVVHTMTGQQADTLGNQAVVPEPQFTEEPKNIEPSNPQRIHESKTVSMKKEKNKEKTGPQHPTSEGKSLPPPDASTGDFTIFIGSFKSKALADGEANRWNEAGYQAFVTEKNRWYRISLGKYTTKETAKQQAEKLKDAFESGFWVDHF